MIYAPHSTRKIRLLYLFWGIVLSSWALLLKIPEIQRQHQIIAKPIEPGTQKTKKAALHHQQRSASVNPKKPPKYEGDRTSGLILGSLISFILLGLAILWLLNSIANYHAAPSGYYCFSEEELLALVAIFLAGLVALMALVAGIQLLVMAFTGRRLLSSPLENMIRYGNNIQYCDFQLNKYPAHKDFQKKKHYNTKQLYHYLGKTDIQIAKLQQEIQHLDESIATPKWYDSPKNIARKKTTLKDLEKKLSYYQRLQTIGGSDTKELLNLLENIEDEYEAKPRSYFYRYQQKLNRNF